MVILSFDGVMTYCLLRRFLNIKFNRGKLLCLF
nr:MAG TPA: hypothetical protein [Caudoviricetes sp.]